ncbi:MAG: N-6 DNA methylase [Treponema sp.]|nr:N-6 DNA methylase [Treponema sp.]
MSSVEKRLCDDLKISSVTVSNWVKTGFIPPTQNINTDEKYKNVINKITTSQKLISRANRNFSKNKFTTYLGIQDENRKLLLHSLIDEFEKSSLSIEQGVLAICYKQLTDNGFLKSENKIKNSIDNWLLNFPLERTIIIKSIFEKFFIPNCDDDIIGAFYQSIQNVSQKSNRGGFYTPAELLQKIKFAPEKTVYDPCCGSGSLFLNTLSKNHNTAKIYASDIDSIALKICHVNLTLFFNNPNIECHFFFNSILESKNDLLKTSEHFDCIITNPPWGIKFNIQEKQILKQTFPQLKTTESFSIALHNSLDMLSKNSKLYFFLPYSFLNVASHRKIRKEIISQKNDIYIKLLGRAFKGVMSEAILLKIDLSTKREQITIEDKNGLIYSLDKEKIKKPDFLIEAENSEFSEKIITQIYRIPHSTLKNNADFALGIVTGNNKKYLLPTKNENTEPIFKGCDILPFKIKQESIYIKFTPEKFQQVANEKLYRSKKIVYRFINSRLVCAIDTKNCLLLNSANLFIPKNKYPFETILCLFNSSIYNFIFQKKFHSTKILRKHLESLPLPTFSEEIHTELKRLYNKFVVEKFIQSELDEKIAKLFNLSNNELKYIVSEVK